MIKIKSEIKNFILIFVGVLCAGMGIEGFLLSSDFIDGGVTGISMLLAKVTHLPLAIWIPLVNFPFILIAFRQIGPAFALRSVLAISGLALAISFIHYPDVTPDLFLTAVFGGIFLGAGIGLAVRGSAVLDGTEIIALLISKRSSLFKVGDVILGFNILLFLAALSILDVNKVLYSIVTYFTAAKTLDFVLYGIDQYKAITIVSDNSVIIRERISTELNRGVTVFKGYGGRSGLEKDILYCVITRLEISKVKAIVREVDPLAFIVTNAVTGAEGSAIKNKFLH